MNLCSSVILNLKMSGESLKCPAKNLSSGSPDILSGESQKVFGKPASCQDSGKYLTLVFDMLVDLCLGRIIL